MTLTHAYVGGPIDGNYIVELTDQALPEASLAAELKFLARAASAGKAQGLMLYVDAKGFVITAIPFAGEHRRQDAGERRVAGRASRSPPARSRVPAR